MTGRFCDELLLESVVAGEALTKAGFMVLSPVIEEGVPNKHIKLTNTLGRLKGYWKRDKEMLQECHIMLDLNSQGKSDGVNVEMGYTRFFMYKPLVRVHPTLGCTISRLEYDCVTDSLEKAVEIIKIRWGTKRKLLKWRLHLLYRSIPKILLFQLKFLKDCI